VKGMFGKAKEIRVKYLHSFSHKKGLEFAVNEWLEQNPEVVVLDIKFAATTTEETGYEDVLIIYKPAQ
jgi:hypothetical protein